MLRRISNYESEAEQQYKLAIAANSFDEKAISQTWRSLLPIKGDLDGAAAYYKQALEATARRRGCCPRACARLHREERSCLCSPVVGTGNGSRSHQCPRSLSLECGLPKTEPSRGCQRELDAYQKYKDIKEKLRLIYKELRLETPQNEEDK